MKRRNFLKICLGVVCIPATAVLKFEPEVKEIEIFTPSEGRAFVKKYKYTGIGKVRSGELMMLKEDGTVCKAMSLAGVAR